MPKKRCLDAGPGLQSSIEESELVGDTKDLEKNFKVTIVHRGI